MLSALPKLLIALTVIYGLSSCATVMNDKIRKTNVYADQASAIVVNNTDTLGRTGRKFKISVPRSSEPLIITAITDSATQKVEIPAFRSFAYWFNIPANGGLGMLADRNNDKRFTYPRSIYINLPGTRNKTGASSRRALNKVQQKVYDGDVVNMKKNSRPGWTRYENGAEKGSIRVLPGIPYANALLQKPVDESPKTGAGFLGISAGFDFYHKKDQYLNLLLAGATDFPVPFPAHIDYSGEMEAMSTVFVAVSNNHDLGRFSLGYGLSYGKNVWEFRYYNRFNPPPPTREPVLRRHNVLGVIIPVHFRFTSHFQLSLLYRPGFYRFNVPDKWEYEHLISLGLAWRVRLKQ